MQQLLPPNHSPLQLKGLQSQDQTTLFDGAIANLTNMKANPHDAQLMWLVWEYGLESILPYSQDVRKTLKDGLAWQRIRGTPKSLTTALGWLELNDAQIENTPPGQHYYTYQIEAGTVPGDERLTKVVNLAQLSAPVSSELTRVYHGYDIRKQTLSSQGCGFGHVLSDYSGVMFKHQGKGLVKASFGRTQKHFVDASVEQISFAHQRKRSQISEHLDVQETGRYCLTTNQPSHLPNIIVRSRLFSQQRTLAQRVWLGPWHDRWQNANWQSQQLCSVQMNYKRITNVAPLSFSGASTGRMNYGTLNLIATLPNG
ncbi:phage tail protein [Pseudoalteromonas sp. S16_S37]|uniref:phage tail protein n=1 Tax=Pseudoalteromonas sp. S16_S37 TaxID=2720228 RepID=UPI0016807D94|nr:phage tail protein [Pseudoalteromonas sp. S16_S37]MBD1581271.1 phage tail protein [Pseudoalteromonas sp. S16_S37]